MVNEKLKEGKSFKKNYVALNYEYEFDLEFSTKCNLNCDYCLWFNQRQEYKTEKINVKNIIKQIGRFDSVVANLGGFGEPFLHPQFVDLISELSQICAVSLVSNGTWPIEIFQNLIQRSHIDNFHHITLSYHPTQMTEKRKKTFFSNVHEIKKSIPEEKTSVCIVLDDYTLKNLDSILYDLQSKGITPVGRYLKEYYCDKHGKKSRCYTPEQMKKISDSGIFVYEGPNNPNLVSWPYSNKKCPCGNHIFSVQPNGDVYDCPCDSRNRRKLGNINSSALLKFHKTPRRCTATTEEQKSCSETNRGQFFGKIL